MRSGAPWVRKFCNLPIREISVIRWLTPDRPSAPQWNQCSISHFLASLGAQENWYCTHIAHQCCGQLTAVKTGYPLTSITWPYRGLRCRPIKVEYFFEVIRWQVTSFQMIAGSSLIFFKFIWNMLCAAQLKFWFQTDLGRENSASYYRQGRQLLLTFLTMVTRWSRSASNFYALIGQNLTDEFMRKIYAASWNCLLWQLKLTKFCVNLWCF